MDLFQKYFEKLRGYADSLLAKLKRNIFGVNNERLDFLLDSFSKLSPNQRLSIVCCGIGAAALLVLGILFFYFSRLNGLESELSGSFDALHDFYNLKTAYQTEEANFSKLAQSVSMKTGQLKVKPFFEEMAQKTGVELQGLSDQPIPISADNRLATKFQYVKADMQLRDISIPRLLNFLSEVEKSNNFLSVENLKISGKYGTKLKFDATVRFRGYVVEGR